MTYTVIGTRPSTIKFYVAMFLVAAALEAAGHVQRYGLRALVGWLILFAVQGLVMRALWDGRSWARTLLTLFCLLNLGLAILVLVPVAFLGIWPVAVPLVVGAGLQLLKLFLLWSYQTTQFIERQPQ